MRKFRNKTIGEPIFANRATTVLDSLIRIAHALSKSFFQPFFRYGFGERYFNYQRGMLLIVMMLGLAWVNYKVAFLDPAKAIKNAVIQEEIGGMLNGQFENDSDSDSDSNKKDTSQSPQERKLEKEKFKYRLRYLTWYLFLVIYFGVIAKHRLQYKRRLAADTYDYTRHSYFRGDSYPFMYALTIKVRDVWLAFVRDVKEMWNSMQKLLSVTIDLTKKKVSRSKDKTGNLNSLILTPVEAQNSKAHKQDSATHEASPEDRIGSSKRNEATYITHPLDHKILVCVVEPGLVILLGVVQLFLIRLPELFAL